MPCIQPNVPVLILESLRKILNEKNIPISEYKPAYNGSSVGLDLWNTTLEDIKLPPREFEHETTDTFKNLIPTGIKVAIPHGWVGIIKERGSIIKTPGKVRAGVIDPDYTGEVFVNCVNLSTHFWDIPAKTKLPFQLVVVQANAHFSIVEEDEYVELTTESTRKEGKIGSSDIQ